MLRISTADVETVDGDAYRRKVRIGAHVGWVAVAPDRGRWPGRSSPRGVDRCQPNMSCRGRSTHPTDLGTEHTRMGSRRVKRSGPTKATAIGGSVAALLDPPYKIAPGF